MLNLKNIDVKNILIDYITMIYIVLFQILIMIEIYLTPMSLNVVPDLNMVKIHIFKIPKMICKKKWEKFKAESRLKWDQAKHAVKYAWDKM